MEAKYKDLDTVWKIMDVRQMDGFSDNSFDVAIDKATMDSMIHGSMWDPPADVRENIARYLGEVSRVLVPGGLFLYITYRQQHFMKPLLAREDWALSVENLNDQEGGVLQYFAYIMKKVDEEDWEGSSDSTKDSGSDTGDERFYAE